jgi:hypothetical protein
MFIIVCVIIKIMDSQHAYTVEEVLEIALALKPEDRKKVQEEIQRSFLNEKEILDRIEPIHQKYDATYKALA